MFLQLDHIGNLIVRIVQPITNGLPRNVTGRFQNGTRWYDREYEPLYTSWLSENISDQWQLCLVGGGEGPVL